MVVVVVVVAVVIVVVVVVVVLVVLVVSAYYHHLDHGVALACWLRCWRVQTANSAFLGRRLTNTSHHAEGAYR